MIVLTLRNDGGFDLPAGKTMKFRASVLLVAVNDTPGVARRLTATVVAGQPGHGFLIKREGQPATVLTLNDGSTTVWEFSTLGVWSQIS